ncbi:MULTISPECIES: restriction endonuclease subunit S [unclassified Citrobacter]|uniref:restriction endonuclease subunit S n=1 Tax=unclassified Citrobacter TaxID=2644389 RepID=UPI00257890C1|nr:MULTISPECIES: restriction endonuclease subunit S [unclassified Citrobacter]MDM2996381.1 restriction endonuclease subunit S [Citrobacter sp. CK195]MDM3129193.1 restriction endonuclease subunit S [Citrobacter sp. CK205]
MSELNYMEQFLDGAEVKWKALGNIAEINTGQKPPEILSCEAEFDYINAGTTRSGYTALSNCDGDTVTTPSRGQGGIGFVGYQKTPFWLGPLCYKMRTIDDKVLINKFLFYFLQSKSELLLGLKKEGGVPAVNKSDLAKLEIPLPPVNEQKRIVTILDKFTALTTELTTELTVRKKLYGHYRDQLLSFDEDKIKWQTLGELAENIDSKRKPVTSGLREAGNIPYYGASGIVDYVKDYIFDGDFLLISEDGANLLARNTPIAFSISGKTWVNNHAHVLKFDTYAERKYIEYYLNNIDLTPYISGAAQPKLNKKNLESIRIPNPSLEEKERIVSILDKFDALTNSISEGLPREIELRQKQYEYYRDLLFSFSKSNAKGGA